MARPDYIPVQPAWTWENGTPQERAEAIRSHQRSLNPDAIRQLFHLTVEGEDMIRRGDIWRSEYETTDTGSVT